MKKFKNFLNEKNYPYYDKDKDKTWVSEYEWYYGDTRNDYNKKNVKNYPYYDDDKGKTWLNEVEWRWGDIT